MSDAAHAPHSPLAQFEIYPIVPMNLLGYDVSFTNASLWMLLSALGLLIFLSVGGKRMQLVPGRWQTAAESVVGMVHGMVDENVGREGFKYFPVVFTLFVFVLFTNMFGMLPYSFTVTSHIIVTFALAMLVFLGVTLIALFRHGPIKFLHYFVPEGTPKLMIPFMFPIELLSYLSRPVSLSIRLAANMMAGHTLLKIIAGFVGVIGLLGVFPFALLVVLIGFELGVALLQAYIFTILTCIYLHDAIHLH